MNAQIEDHPATVEDLRKLNHRLQDELAKALAASIVPRNGENSTRAVFAIDYGRHTKQTSTYLSPSPSAPQ